MNLFNSVKTQIVSRKNYSPPTYQIKTHSDGSLSRVPLDNTPIPGNADDFSLENQFKTGVKFDAPKGDFFKQKPLDVSDTAQRSADILDKIEPPLSSETPPSSETPLSSE